MPARPARPDRVFIRDLLCRGILGINPDERTAPQDVLVNVVLECDARPAAASRDIADAVNYRTVAKGVLNLVETGEYLLVETLCEDVAALCLEDQRVTACEVTVDKPTALRFAGGVGVSIRRERAGAS